MLDNVHNTEIFAIRHVRVAVTDEIRTIIYTVSGRSLGKCSNI